MNKSDFEFSPFDTETPQQFMARVLETLWMQNYRVTRVSMHPLVWWVFSATKHPHNKQSYLEALSGGDTPRKVERRRGYAPGLVELAIKEDGVRVGSVWLDFMPTLQPILKVTLKFTE